MKMTMVSSGLQGLILNFLTYKITTYICMVAYALKLGPLFNTLQKITMCKFVDYGNLKLE